MFDKERATRAVRFIELLKHTKGQWAGRPFKLLDWQRDKVVEPIFGNVDENGNRTIRKAYVEIPKKNGKSELAAAIALYLLFADGEYGAEIYSAACDREQASIVFNVAANMVRQDATLSKKLKVLDSTKRILYREKNSYYHVLSADSYTKHGYNTHGVIFDELHAQPNRDLWDVLTEGAGDARTQPLIFAITTAGYDKHSVCYEVHEYAEKVQKGVIEDEHFLPVLYGLPEDEDWTKEENWYKVNPSLDKTITIDKLRDAFKEAQEIPAKQNLFRRLRLNQWTAQETRWLDLKFWDHCPKIRDMDRLNGRLCYAGLDLASSIDIAAFVLVFPDEMGFFDVVPYMWVPEDRIQERVHTDKVPYDAWVRDGHLIATEGNVIHYDRIEADIEELGKRYNIAEIGFDRWGAVQISQHLSDMGFTVVPFGQGFKDMSPPTKEFQKLIMSQKIRHNANPVMRWMFDNIAIRTDPAENVKMDKSRSTERIDGMVATVMGLGRAIVNAGESVYAERGVITL